jgi:hypothetical protein
MRANKFMRLKNGPATKPVPMPVEPSPMPQKPLIEMLAETVPATDNTVVSNYGVLVEPAAPVKPAIITPDEFMSVFFRHLIEAKNKHPESYEWGDIDVLEVFRRFSESFRTGTYTRHCHAVKWTCKELKIKWDRKAIDAIFEGDQNGTP